MTQLVYVPKHMVEIWKRRGWGLVYPQEFSSTAKAAVLMHPPGWAETEKKDEEKSG